MDANRLNAGSSLALVTILLTSIVALSYPIPSVWERFHLANDADESSTMARSCAGPGNVDRIRVLPPGPVLLAADDVLELNATMFDSNDVELSGPPTWGADGGTIQVMDSHVARFSPSTTGQHSVWACAGSVNTSVNVNVVIGEVTDMRLRTSTENVTADDIVLLDLVRMDARGNEQPAFILDTTNWTVPEGSSISLPIGTPAEWTPGQVGAQTITVSDGGFTAILTLNVSHGVATALTIEGWTDGAPIDADSVADLTMSLRDKRGNGWMVNGTWELLGTDGDSQLLPNGSNASFDASMIGAWTIEGSYEDPDSGGHRFVGTLEMVVVPGRLAWLELAGAGTTVRIGEPMHLSPSGRDADGNDVTLSELEWSISGTSSQSALDSENLTFSPTAAGQHVIIVESGARIAQITVGVIHGIPESIVLKTEDGTGLSVVTGEEIGFSVIGTDNHGNEYPVDVEWTVPDGFGNVTPDAGGVGAYLYSAEGTGYVNLVATIGNETWNNVFHILPGEPASISIELFGEAVQRQSIEARLEVVDEAGNAAVFGACSVQVTSTAGPTSCLAGKWTIELLNSGDQQRVEARLDDAYGVAFVDVDPVLLGGILGSDQTVMLLGGSLVALLICGVLLAGYWKSGVMLRDRRTSSNDAESIEGSEASESSLPTLVPEGGAQPAQPGSSTSIPTMLANRMPIPPPASVFSSPSADIPAPYAAAAHQKPPHPDAIQAAAPSAPLPVHQPVFQPIPAIRHATPIHPAPSGESTIMQVATPALTPLGAAFDALGGSVEERFDGQDGSDDEGASVEVDTEAQRGKIEIATSVDGLGVDGREPAPNSRHPAGTSDADSELDRTRIFPDSDSHEESVSGSDGPTSSHSQVDREDVQQDDLGHADPLEEGGDEPRLAPDDGDPWALEWYTPGAALPRERGPRMGISPLKPLPGTNPGDNGWYFDDDGRPSHWEHSADSGWERTGGAVGQ